MCPSVGQWVEPGCSLEHDYYARNFCYSYNLSYLFATIRVIMLAIILTLLK